MKDFLPPDYKEPTTSGGYLNMKDYDEVTFRILSPAIVGYEYWTTDNKPVRAREAFTELPKDIKYVKNKEGLDVPSKINYFWIMQVWNYSTNSIQVMEITQKTIRQPILDLINNKKWGSPNKYDLTIIKKGKGFDTEYSVIPSPHSDLPKEAVEAFEASSINLEAMYDGGNPFAATSSTVTTKTKKGTMERADYPTEEINSEDIPF